MRTGRAVRSEKMVFDWHRVVLFAKFLSSTELFHANLMSRLFIRVKDSFHQYLCRVDLMLLVTQYQNMLVLIVIWLRRVPFFMRVFAPYQYFATGLLLKLLLVYTFGSDKQPHVVNALYMREVYFATVLEHFRVG